MPVALTYSDLGKRRLLFLMLLITAACLLINWSPVLAAQPQPANQTIGITCSWNGNTYSPGERFFNQVGQLYICNSDGTISYIGMSPNYPAYPNPNPYPYPFEYNYAYSPNMLSNYLWGAYAMPGYQYPYSPPSTNVSQSITTTNYPQLPYYAQTCQWAGIIYLPAQKFCNSACQEYICNSDGTIVWTGKTGGSTCPVCVHHIEVTTKK